MQSIGTSGRPDEASETPSGALEPTRVTGRRQVLQSATLGALGISALALPSAASAASPGLVLTGGSSWTAIAATELSLWDSVAYGDGTWVAVAAGEGTNRVMRSTDNGLSWNRDGITGVPAGYAWRSVAFGDPAGFADGVWMAIASFLPDGDTTVVMRSTDRGVTWTNPATTVPAGDLTAWRSVAYGNGVFVAVASNGTNKLMRSTNNGATWTAVAQPSTSQWVSVTYGDPSPGDFPNGVWVAVAQGGTGSRVMRSEDDGVTWTAADAAEANQWQSVAYGNSVFVAVASTGTNRVMRSANGGETWTAVAATEENAWQSVAYGNGVWVAVSRDGTNRVMRSTNNGLSWTTATPPEANPWRAVAYGNGVWIAVAQADTLEGAADAKLVMRGVE
jgi:hypothetical protein